MLKNDKISISPFCNPSWIDESRWGSLIAAKAIRWKAGRELSHRWIRVIYWSHWAILTTPKEKQPDVMCLLVWCCKKCSWKKKIEPEHNRFSRSHYQATTSFQETQRTEKHGLYDQEDGKFYKIKNSVSTTSRCHERK